MNFYVSLIIGAVDFVEANIQNRLSLDDVSREFNFSAFHFNRIFRTVTGRTLKQYILGRKLSLAMERLVLTPEPVIQIAYDYGFESPEVFSRAFKKQFGISPNFFRQTQPQIEPVQKVNVVERDIINYQGQLALKGSGVYLDGFELEGVDVNVNVNQMGFELVLQKTGDTYYQEARKTGRFNPEMYYALVNCLGDDNGDYNVFYGMRTAFPESNEQLVKRFVPASWYEKFTYCGDIFDVRVNFVNDLYRWVMLKEVELVSNGIGMLDIFREDYPETREVEILVPVKAPC
jgi:AraC family transcriptional regulator